MARLIFIFIFLGLVACTDKSEGLSISDSDYDFGIVPDTISILHHKFKITNNSQDSCTIKRIDKSCGCTHVQLNKYTIAPYDSAFLDVRIDMGTNYNLFERDISIYTDNTNEPYMVYVRASRKLPTKLASKIYPLKLSDNIRVSTPYLMFGNICFGDAKSESINILNSSDKALPISAKIINAPPFIEVFCNDEISPNEIGRISVVIDLSKVKNIWGLQKYILRLESRKNTTNIPIEAIFVEKFTPSKEQPRILVKVSNYTIDTSKKNNVSFIIENIGTAPLHIRNIKLSNSKCVFKLNKYKIDPNQEGILTIDVDNDMNQNKNLDIGVTTNDKIEPYKILHVFYKPNNY